ncbi:hypothetical protein ABZP36_024128 [Zizania latifolia]
MQSDGRDRSNRPETPVPSAPNCVAALVGGGGHPENDQGALGRPDASARSLFFGGRANPRSPPIKGPPIPTHFPHHRAQKSRLVGGVGKRVARGGERPGGLGA